MSSRVEPVQTAQQVAPPVAPLTYEGNRIYHRGSFAMGNPLQQLGLILNHKIEPQWVKEQKYGLRPPGLHQASPRYDR